QRGGLPARLRRDGVHARPWRRCRAGPDAGERHRAGSPRRAAAGRGRAQERRMKIPLTYNLRSVRQRPVSTALTALGIGLVVAVFIAMLALANGFVAALVKTGSSENVLLLRRGADSELSSGIPRDAISIISASPYIATGADGRPMVSPE